MLNSRDESNFLQTIIKLIVNLFCGCDKLVKIVVKFSNFTTNTTAKKGFVLGFVLREKFKVCNFLTCYD